jgi:hypothetical protein
MKKWCKGKRYSECMVAGAARIDLQSKEVGFVTKDEVEWANNPCKTLLNMTTSDVIGSQVFAALTQIALNI